MDDEARHEKSPTPVSCGACSCFLLSFYYKRFRRADVPSLGALFCWIYERGLNFANLLVFFEVFWIVSCGYRHAILLPEFQFGNAGL